MKKKYQPLITSKTQDSKNLRKQHESVVEEINNLKARVFDIDGMKEQLRKKNQLNDD